MLIHVRLGMEICLLGRSMRPIEFQLVVDRALSLFVKQVL